MRFGETVQPTGEIGGLLSPRECLVLELISQGLSNKEIARNLGIAAETVKSHVKRIFIKLRAARRAQAVSRAQLLGLLRVSSDTGVYTPMSPNAATISLVQ
jgi:ATP/maltotriose-dependent transcriptional regulator MalT